MKTKTLTHLDSHSHPHILRTQPPPVYDPIAHMRRQIDAAYARIAILETGESAYMEAAILAKTHCAAPALIARLEHAFTVYRDRVKQVYRFLHSHEQQSVFYAITMRPNARAKPTRHAIRRYRAAGIYRPDEWYALDAAAYTRAYRERAH